MFAKFMNKKDFHPGSNANIKKVWMAEQKRLAHNQKQQELTEQYQREQERYQNRQLVSNDDKLKSGLGFLYDAPPGYEKDKETKKEEEEEPRFEWQKGAPREGYTKNLNLAVRDQPFGIPVRNVRCIRCGKWGHVNTDRECPKLNKTSLSKSDPSTFADVTDPAQLMKDMRDGGLALKQGVLGRKFDPHDPNQQILASDEEEQDPEAEFLASLTDKQKRKLLRKLDKLEKRELNVEGSKSKAKKKRKKYGEEHKKKHEERNKRYSRPSDSEEESEKKKKRNKRYSPSDSEEESAKKKKRNKRYSLSDSEEESKKKKKRNKRYSLSDSEEESKKKKKRNKRYSLSDSEEECEKKTKRNKRYSPSDSEEESAKKKKINIRYTPSDSKEENEKKRKCKHSDSKGGSSRGK